VSKINRRPRLATVVAAALVVYTATAAAQTWRYRDAEGNVHYTDDYYAIPKERRDQAREFKAQKNPDSAYSKSTGGPAAPEGQRSSS